MARARKVDAETALGAAVLAFWQTGFHSLGTRQMEEETGITRFSLQTAYGGKRVLFLKALDAYLDRFEAEMLPGMADGTLDGLARWFEVRCMRECAFEGSQWGCLMINSIVEFGGSDADVVLRSDRFYAMLRSGFRDALERIKENGEVSQTLDVAGSAEVLMTASIGLNVVIRSAADVEAGQPMAACIAAMVRGWAVH